MNDEQKKQYLLSNGWVERSPNHVKRAFGDDVYFVHPKRCCGAFMSLSSAFIAQQCAEQWQREEEQKAAEAAAKEDIEPKSAIAGLIALAALALLGFYVLVDSDKSSNGMRLTANESTAPAGYYSPADQAALDALIDGISTAAANDINVVRTLTNGAPEPMPIVINQGTLN